jgi:hypothetical protein
VKSPISPQALALGDALEETEVEDWLSPLREEVALVIWEMEDDAEGLVSVTGVEV